jgi:hypothetical protein
MEQKMFIGGEYARFQVLISPVRVSSYGIASLNLGHQAHTRAKLSALAYLIGDNPQFELFVSLIEGGTMKVTR